MHEGHVAESGDDDDDGGERNPTAEAAHSIRVGDAAEGDDDDGERLPEAQGAQSIREGDMAEVDDRDDDGVRNPPAEAAHSIRDGDAAEGDDDDGERKPEAEGAYAIREGDRVQAVAAIQLALICDAISPDTFSEFIKVCKLIERNTGIRKIIAELTHNCQEVKTIGEFYTHERGDRDPGELLWTFQRWVISGRLPRRWKQSLLLSAIDEILTAPTSQLAIRGIRALHYMLPGLELFPESKPLMDMALELLQTPLGARDSVRDVASEFQALLVGEFRQRLRVFEDHDPDDDDNDHSDVGVGLN